MHAHASSHSLPTPPTPQFLPTKDYPAFDDAFSAFLKEPELQGHRPEAAAFACAGPVTRGRCEMTNLGWAIDEREIADRFGITSTVLNDFEAVGYGVPALPDSALLTLYEARMEAQGPKAVLGPGTGLGEAQLFWDEALGNYRVCSSEGSHATFAPRGWKQRALQAHVQNERGHCSVERVGCGDGLRRIYDFLGSDEVSQYPGRDLALKRNPAEISTAALDGSDPRALEALDIFLSIVGAEAGQMALRGLTTGGVYICGGIFPKVIDRVKAGGVTEAFLWKDSRFHDKVLKHIPLFVVLEEKVGLIGTREQAIRILVQRTRDIANAT